MGSGKPSEIVIIALTDRYSRKLKESANTLLSFTECRKELRAEHVPIVLVCCVLYWI